MDLWHAVVLGTTVAVLLYVAKDMDSLSGGVGLGPTLVGPVVMFRLRSDTVS
jgi:hypothetical protein